MPYSEQLWTVLLVFIKIGSDPYFAAAAFIIFLCGFALARAGKL